MGWLRHEVVVPYAVGTLSSSAEAEKSRLGAGGVAMRVLEPLRPIVR